MKTGKTDTRALDVDMEERSQIDWGKGLGVSGGVKATKKELCIPQSEADFVRKAVERMERGVSHEMIGLRDRCREPFALFVPNFVRTVGEGACMWGRARRGWNTHKTTNSHASSASLM